MSEQSSFFNAVITNGVPDRIYKAEIFARFFSSFIGNGVFPNPSTNLQVVSIDNNMTVRVKKGKAWINGYYYENSDDLILNIDNADGVLNRIDSIVLRLDFLNREIRSYVKKGIFSNSPSAPDLVRDSAMCELCLANVRIDAGVITIAQSKITDTRLNNELCGIVTQTVNTIDTSVLYNQLENDITEKGLDMQTWLDGAKEYFSNWLQATQGEFSSEFNTWFDGIKNILDESTAGTLLNMINANSTRIDDVERQLANIDTTAEKTTLQDTSNLFEATNVEGALSEVMTKSNEALQSGVNAKTGMKEAINSKITVPDVSDADAWNTYIQRVKDIKEGRGNAGTGDVLSGKTFTNDSGQMQTGAIPNRGGAQTVTPGTSNKVLNSGYYSGNITVAGDSDLVAGNILSGKNIFGVVGNVVAGKRWASGTSGVTYAPYPSGSSRYAARVSGLAFTPSVVIISISDNTYSIGIVNGKFKTYSSANNRCDAVNPRSNNISTYPLDGDKNTFWIKDNSFSVRLYYPDDSDAPKLKFEWIAYE